MSVFSITALDRLIEADRKSTTPAPMEKHNTERRPPYVSYSSNTFASAQPRSPSPSSFSPSPYVVNHKRRTPLDSKRASQQNGFHVSDKSSVSRPPAQSQELLWRSKSANWPLNADSVSKHGFQEGPLVGENSRSPQSSLTVQFQTKKVCESDADPSSFGYNGGRMAATEEKTEGRRIAGERRDMSSRNDDPRGKKKLEDRYDEGTSAQEGIASSRDKFPHLFRTDTRSSSGSSSEEWFDAPDVPLPEYSSDDDIRRSSLGDPGPSSRGDPDSNIVLQLKAEIERRIAAEEAREALQRQHDGMAHMLSSAGISLLQSDVKDTEIAKDSKVVGVSDCEAQRLIVARYVAGAVATGAVRADAEAQLQTVLAEKSREISRLKDKLQYYELVNHEMSQRNQESIENARQSRRRRQRRQRLVVFGLGAAICLGLSAAAVYQYLPWEHFKGLGRASDGERADANSLEKVIDFTEPNREN